MYCNMEKGEQHIFDEYFEDLCLAMSGLWTMSE
jgi:hypothetical protein